MNLPAEKFHFPPQTEQADADAEYIAVRVLDALLRENVRDCMSRGTLVDAAALPPALLHDMAADFAQGQRWLRITHFGESRLWIPVSPHHFMQPWRLTRLPAVSYGPTGWRVLCAVADILACFRDGLTEQEAQGFIEFEAECRVAVAHRRTCEAERRRWFGEWQLAQGQASGADLPAWEQRLLHYDRLAAFHDHPYYPTARAKLGFDVDDLRRYAPEFQSGFELNWLAVPRALYFQDGTSLPPAWPSFAQVGLDAGLADTHALMPVHPFVWRDRLDRFLLDNGLAEQVIRAPGTALRVLPTLSVRTLALHESPGWHVKLPLTIRTLGAKNIRTIKPSTIADGHCIQTLLAGIVAREPALHDRVVLTAEDTGAHVAKQPMLGFIVRRYPDPHLRDATVIPVAALSAQAPDGRRVVDEIVDRFFGGDRDAFLDDYLALTLHLHLTLWVRYGVALESNQQNSMLVLRPHTSPLPRLGLLLKDNDAARIRRNRLERRWPDLAAPLAGLQDQRIVVDEELPLAQMFTTITLQLNIAALVETVAQAWDRSPAELYATVRRHTAGVLEQLQSEGEEVAFARSILLDEERLYIKYLLIAATLADKSMTGAADVNKYYGRSAPNFLREVR